MIIFLPIWPQRSWLTAQFNEVLQNPVEEKLYTDTEEVHSQSIPKFQAPNRHLC